MQETQHSPPDGLKRDSESETKRAEALMTAAGYSQTGRYADEVEAEDLEPRPMSPAGRRGLLVGLIVLVILGLAAVLPPLINVNRYQRRIVSSISTSLGRPVHLDSVTLNLLPLPSFTLTNFVVSEDPSFGSEPVIRANTVKATLRMRSLWHRRVEFSRIALDEPSVNLVRGRDGRWNIESILLQAARMPADPTEQKNAGAAPRFPYIEATGGRVNLKQGLVKKAISLTDAEFALWLSAPNVWRLRLEAHPARTDTAATDTGLFRMEGTLGRAESMATVPMDLQAAWTSAPLGAATWVMMGRDAGLRGDMTWRTTLKGTLGDHLLTTRLELRNLHRADFVPAKMLDIDVDCKAHTTGVVHLEDLQCGSPGSNGGSGFVVTGAMPDMRHLESANLHARWTKIPASALLDALRVASSRDSSGARATGTVSGDLICCDPAIPLLTQGSFVISHARLAVDDGAAVVDEPGDLPGQVARGTVTLAPVALSLGGIQPATLIVTADESGLRMRLTGSVLPSRLTKLTLALPVFGEGLKVLYPAQAAALKASQPSPEAPVKVDLASFRAWGGTQVWSPSVSRRTERRR